MLICLLLCRYKTVNFNCFNNQHLNQHHQSHYFANNFDALAKHLASCFWCISNWYIDEQLVPTTTRQVHPPTETLYLMYQMCQMSTTYNSTRTTYTSITVSLIMIYWLYNVYTWIIDYLFTKLNAFIIELLVIGKILLRSDIISQTCEIANFWMIIIICDWFDCDSVKQNNSKTFIGIQIRLVNNDFHITSSDYIFCAT